MSNVEIIQHFLHPYVSHFVPFSTQLQDKVWGMWLRERQIRFELRSAKQVILDHLSNLSEHHFLVYKKEVTHRLDWIMLRKASRTVSHT